MATLTFKRLIGKTVILNGFISAKITSHSISENQDGSIREDVYARIGGYEFYVDLKDKTNTMVVLDKNITFVNKKNVIIAILSVKNQVKVGYAIYKEGDIYDIEFGRALAIYRALVDRDISGDDFAEIYDEYEGEDEYDDDDEFEYDDDDEYEFDDEFDDDEDENF